MNFLNNLKYTGIKLILFNLVVLIRRLPFDKFWMTPLSVTLSPS